MLDLTPDRMLTVNIHHLQHDEFFALRDSDGDGEGLLLYFYRNNYGFIISTCFNLTRANLLPDTLRTLFTLAHSNDCNWLYLHHHGKILPLLPTYNW